MEIIGRWWNRHWGRMARRDIWLTSGPEGWVVRARKGDSDGPEVRYVYSDESIARAMVQRLMDTSPGDLRDLTEAMRLQRGRRGSLDAAGDGRRADEPPAF